ncbi:MAG: hypothetical protein GXW99_00260 [Clostridiales bacterium]|nr:hypothetical protein [Clostridiales bacterium]
MSRHDLIMKWILYSAGALCVVLIQSLILNHIRILSVHPFLIPMLAAIVASFEGPRDGCVFGLIFGVLCDVTTQPPIPCFYTLAFVLIAFLSALVAKNLIAPGFCCSLVVSAMSLLVTQLFYTLIFTYRSIGSTLGILSLMGRELLISLVLSPLLYLLFSRIHRKMKLD